MMCRSLAQKLKGACRKELSLSVHRCPCSLDLIRVCLFGRKELSQSARTQYVNLTQLNLRDCLRI
eukprot:jgi/Botrbrau1/21627/Bobra.43_1s0029.1